MAIIYLFQMLGLYRDPEGNSVEIVNATPHEVPTREPDNTREAEIQKLRHRISELERRVRFKHWANNIYFTNTYHSYAYSFITEFCDGKYNEHLQP